MSRPAMPGSQMIFSSPSSRDSSASHRALSRPGLRLALSTQLSVMMAVPSPSTSMPPPSSTRRVATRAAPRAIGNHARHFGIRLVLLLVAPAVEVEADPHKLPCSALDEHRAGIAHPEVVDLAGHQLDRGAAQTRGGLLLLLCAPASSPARARRSPARCPPRFCLATGSSRAPRSPRWGRRPSRWRHAGRPRRASARLRRGLAPAG